MSRKNRHEPDHLHAGNGHASADAGIVEMTLRLPLLTDLPATGYVSDHLEVRLSPEQAATYQRLFMALNRLHATLADGRHVDYRQDALRWILERLTFAAGG